MSKVRFDMRFLFLQTNCQVNDNVLLGYKTLIILCYDCMWAMMKIPSLLEQSNEGITTTI